MAYDRRSYSGNAAATTLLNPILSTDLSFQVAAGGGANYPSGGGGNFIVLLDRGTSLEEKVLCSARTSDTFTVAASGRGYDGTTAQGHSSSATVEHTIDKVDLDEANNVVNATLGAITAKGDWLLGSAANTLVKRAASANNTVPYYDSTQASGVNAALLTTSQLSATAGITSAQLANTAVVANPYGSAQQSPTFTVNAQGQLTAAANVTIDDTAKIAKSVFTTKGDTLATTGASTPVRKAVGANATILQADSAQADNLQWAALSGDATIAVGGALTIANLAVTGAKIANTTITDGKMAAHTLTNASIAAATITSTELAAALPLGKIAEANVTADQSGIGTSYTDLTGLTVTFTAVASRRYRITGYAIYSRTGGSSTEFISTNIYNSTASSQLAANAAYVQGLGGTFWGGAPVIWEGTLSAGSTTIKMQAVQGSAGTTTMKASSIVSPAFLLVEDIGL